MDGDSPLADFAHPLVEVAPIELLAPLYLGRKVTSGGQPFAEIDQSAYKRIARPAGGDCHLERIASHDGLLWCFAVEGGGLPRDRTWRVPEDGGFTVRCRAIAASNPCVKER